MLLQKLYIFGSKKIADMAFSYKQILKKKKKWVVEKTAPDPHFFERLALHQTPDYLFRGCSDSRANPDEISGLGLGDIFVHRNI